MTIERMFTQYHMQFIKTAEHKEIEEKKDGLVRVKMYSANGGALALAIGWALMKELPADQKKEVNGDDYAIDMGWTIRVVDNKFIRFNTIQMFVSDANYQRLENYAGGMRKFEGGDCKRFVPPSTTTLLYGDDLLAAYSMFIYRIKDRLLVVDEQNKFIIIAAVLPLVIFDGVALAIEGFKNAFEEGIEMIDAEELRQPHEEHDNAGVANFFRNFATQIGIDLSQNAPSYMNRDEAYALALLHAISMSKTGPPEHFRLAIEKRLSSLKLALKLKDLDVKKFMVERYHYDTCQRIYENMSLYPLLKAHIYSEILTQQNPLSAHMRIILKEAQFTTFNLIFLFINSEQLTMLHTLPEVVDEFATYQEAFQMLVTKYGAGWPYCKLINPEESCANTVRFPNLARAGRAFALVKPEISATIANLQGVRTVPDKYVKWASRVIPKGDHPLHANNLNYMISQLRIVRPQDDLTGLTEDLYADLARQADEGEIPAYVREALDLTRRR